MAMAIRRLNQSDADAFYPLRERMLAEHPESFTRYFDDEDVLGASALAERLDDTNPECGLYGAFVNGELAGSIGFYRERGDKLRHKATLWGAYVAEEAQGNGLGRALIEACLEQIKSLDGVVQVYASVASGNPTAQHLYESFGFKSFGTEPRALNVKGKYWDEDHMILPLSP